MRPIIAYPGVPGSFSEGAARDAFPEGTHHGYATFAEAAKAAAAGPAKEPACEEDESEPESDGQQ